MPAVAESFNKADSSTLGPDLTWTEDRGDVQVVSNAVRPVSANTLCQARTAGIATNAVRTASVVVKTFTTPSSGSNFVMACTYAASANTVYFGARISIASDGTCTLDLINYFNGSVANTYATTTITKPTAPFTLTCRINAIGNNAGGGADALINGVSLLNYSGSSMAGTTDGGIVMFTQNSVGEVEVDSFAADDHNLTPTLTHVCGAECGIAAVGTLSAGTEHINQVTGTVTNVTTGPTPMRSGRCFRMQNGNIVVPTTVASGGPAVGRAAFYFATLPSVDSAIFTTANNTQGIYYHQASGTLRCGAGTSLMAASGISITTGTWYVLDVAAVRAASSTTSGKVNGTALTNYNFASAAASDVGFRLGASTSSDVYVDDIAVSVILADFPIGDSKVIGLYPNADRTNSAANPTDGNFGHLYSTTTDFGKGASGASALGAQNAESTSWQSLDNPLTTTAGGSWISDLLGTSSERLVWQLDDLPGDATSVNGVMLVATTHSASATANNCTVEIRNTSGTSAGGWSLDLSESTITVPCIMRDAPGSAGTLWTVSTVNDAVIWFYSTDVNPDVYLDGVCLEVDYIAVVSGDATATPGAVSITVTRNAPTGGAEGVLTSAAPTITRNTPTANVGGTPASAAPTLSALAPSGGAGGIPSPATPVFSFGALVNPNATASPGVVQLLMSVLAPGGGAGGIPSAAAPTITRNAPSGGAGGVPTTAQLLASLLTPAGGAGGVPNPATPVVTRNTPGGAITATPNPATPIFTVLAPTANVGGTPAPATPVFFVQQPTATGGGSPDATAQPGAVALVLTALAPGGGIVAFPSPVTPVVSVLAPGGGVVVIPSPVTPIVTRNTPSGSIVAFPAPVTPILSVLAPTASGGALALPGAVAPTITTNAPAGGAGGVPGPALLALTALSPAGSSLVTASTVAPTIAALAPSGGAGGVPAAALLAYSFPVPSSAGGSVGAPPPVQLVVTALAPTASGGALTTPASTALTIVRNAPAGGAGGVPTSALLAVSVPTPTSSSSATATPGAAPLVFTVLAPTASGQSVAQAGVVAAIVNALTPAGGAGGLALPTLLTITVLEVSLATGVILVGVVTSVEGGPGLVVGVGGAPGEGNGAEHTPGLVVGSSGARRVRTEPRSGPGVTVGSS